MVKIRKDQKTSDFEPIFNNSLYNYNVAILKEYNGSYKLQLHKVVRSAGFELKNSVYTEKNSVNDEKLDCNISRAKSRIFELALCNPWDYFITVTLDAKKYNRNDLEKFRKDFSQYIRNTGKKYNCKIHYLLIPEEHSKGGWHMHGFLKGLPAEELREFKLSEKLPEYIRNKLKDGQTVSEWVGYRKRFGFNDIEPIRNQRGVSAYVTKYITKDLTRTVKDAGAHLYYCSKGLQRATIVSKGELVVNLDENDWDFSNEYYSCKWLDGYSKLEAFNTVKSYNSIIRDYKDTRNEHLENLTWTYGEMDTPFD